MLMIKIKSSKSSQYYFTSGNWEAFFNADSKESALNNLISEIKSKPELSLGKVLICINLDAAIKDLTLEDSLFFIPIEELIERFES